VLLLLHDIARWLSKAWIGNFDLLLTSSAVAASFFRFIPGAHCHCRLYYQIEPVL
jgi:hypothetical protein